MKNWIPVPGTVKAKILELAVKDFSAKGYQGVHVKDLAKAADVTTGAIYHHFESKVNLYAIVREEMERRIVDRMEGAAAVFDDPADSMKAAVLVGFDAAVKFDACRLLSEEDPSQGPDRIADFIGSLPMDEVNGLAYILPAAWRAALLSVEEERLTVEDARKALGWIFEN
ncbi:MAG TPA: TetR family transcriptional regulator [Bacillales bacterium]|nr:TetR family transcriptional regulator [Bacillales bacterium]